MKSPIDLSLYLVTHCEGITENEFLRRIREAIDGGVKIVQLREKEASDAEVIELGSKLLQMLKPFNIPLIINDRITVALALGAEGVHLGQSDRKVAEARAILGNEAIIGLSVESIEQAYLANHEDVDYIAVGPVFSTQTKLDCITPCGLEELKSYHNASKHPIVAIGGIDETKVQSVMESGATGIAVSSAILNSKCSKTAAIKMLHHLQRFTVHKVLSIAGFDGSGGAGMQADLKTFSALGCYGTTALTSIPVQNTLGVRSIYDVSTDCIEEQIKAVLDDMQMHAVKMGMLYREDIIETVARILQEYQVKNIVLDPVMVAKSGDLLLQPTAVQSMIKRLFPITTVLTPNLMEASELLGREICTHAQMETAAREILEWGPQAVIIKGGHLNGNCDDCLVLKNQIHWFSSSRIQTRNTHGTGCTFSAAIASFLAKGFSIYDAVSRSKTYLTAAIQAGSHLHIGRGNGPVHHFHNIWSPQV